MLAYWIWFAEMKMSPHKKAALLKHFSDPEDIYFAEEAAFGELEVTEEQIALLEDKDLTAAEKILATCRKKDIGILTMADALYPDRLRNIDDPPVVLYYRGTFPDCNQNPTIAVVGTRKASGYGLRSAKRLSAEIAACGGRLISGGAVGIDAWATEGALTCDRGHILVLGGGVDVIYPRENRALFEHVAKNGCLISEYPPGTATQSWHFPQRNRIISGISDGVLVVEAPERSGALITAKDATEQGRDLFVVPGNIDVAACAGSNALLRQGAIAAFSGWDIVREYERRYPDAVRQAVAPELDFAGAQTEEKVPQSAAISGKSPDKTEKTGKITIDKKAESSYSGTVSAPVSLSAQEQAVYDHVPRAPVSMDEVIAACDLPSGAVLSALTMLSMKGVVQMHPGRRVSRK